MELVPYIMLGALGALCKRSVVGMQGMLDTVPPGFLEAIHDNILQVGKILQCIATSLKVKLSLRWYQLFFYG